MSEHQWYALKVVGGQEAKVKFYLESEVDKHDLGAFLREVLMPTEKVYEMRAGKKVLKERTFFPGYLLVSADLSDGRIGAIVRSIPGALGFLGDAGWSLSKAPTPLRESEVDKLLGNHQSGGYDDMLPQHAFLVGEAVRVVDGPFNGFVGHIQEIFEERKKLNVAVRIFERETPVELGYVQVEKTT